MIEKYKVYFDAAKKYKIYIAAALIFFIVLVLVLSSTNKDPFEYIWIGQSEAEVISKLGKPDLQDDDYYQDEYLNVKFLGERGTLTIELDASKDVRMAYLNVCFVDEAEVENYIADVTKYYTKKYGEPRDCAYADAEWNRGDARLLLSSSYKGQRYMVSVKVCGM